MMMFEFPITRPVLPDADVYQAYLDKVFDARWLTNSGPMLQQLEQQLAEYLGVEQLMLVCNGTLALHVAYRALQMGPRILTTPFSFAATASSLVWEGHQCQFVDVDRHSFNISLEAMDDALLQQADGIVATHVFGNPCDIEGLAAVAQQHHIPVVYDAAHAFGCQYQGRSLLQWGDAATLSLHATKIFHTVEGGAIIFRDPERLRYARELINFGLDGQQVPRDVGINAKMSELHAAMGLALLPLVDRFRQQREACVAVYQQQLAELFEFQQWAPHSRNNGAYMPVLCRDERQLLALMSALATLGVQTRRYFYPSLSTLPCYGEQGSTPVADAIALRSLCLPLYGDMLPEHALAVCERIKQALRQQP